MDICSELITSAGPAVLPALIQYAIMIGLTTATGCTGLCLSQPEEHFTTQLGCTL